MNALSIVIRILLLLSLVLLFKPLLAGLLRAAWLTVNPRLSKEERKARRAMRDSELVHKLINRGYGPSDAAELRALACRQ